MKQPRVTALRRAAYDAHCNYDDNGIIRRVADHTSLLIVAALAITESAAPAQRERDTLRMEDWTVARYRQAGAVTFEVTNTAR